ncbi:endocuticle structural glycoprotein ABD-5-like [Daktulosphaira vitifoliae]|uniref:endocuticle structural glycoprotein ABD-5-like n=1 Tax=Daktulosphaira vitifoliae TaxID=58002 RepID=UPI0021A97D0C|nr:endocuticle structural glycoprotein ABD-5-like [Daktulosphaira vitifoliae]
MFAAATFFVVFINFCLAAPSPASFQQYAPSSIKPPVAFLQNDRVTDNSGQYSLLYRSEDGITNSQQGALAANDKENDYVMEQKGSYSYKSPEGIEVKMNYSAGKDGFKVWGYPLPDIK